MAKQQLQQHAQRLSTQLHTATKSWKPPDLSKGLGEYMSIQFKLLRQLCNTTHSFVRWHVCGYSGLHAGRCANGCNPWLPAGMKVDIDFLNPAITGLKQQWQQLPEPVRDVLPYTGGEGGMLCTPSARHITSLQAKHVASEMICSLGCSHTGL